MPVELPVITTAGRHRLVHQQELLDYGSFSTAPAASGQAVPAPPPRNCEYNTSSAVGAEGALQRAAEPASACHRRIQKADISWVVSSPGDSPCATAPRSAGGWDGADRRHRHPQGPLSRGPRGPHAGRTAAIGFDQRGGKPGRKPGRGDGRRWRLLPAAVSRDGRGGRANRPPGGNLLATGRPLRIPTAASPELHGAITWPDLPTLIALAVVGFLIWIGDILGRSAGRPIDFLGLGLTGNRGLAIYASVLAVVGVALFLWSAQPTEG